MKNKSAAKRTAVNGKNKRSVTSETTGDRLEAVAGELWDADSMLAHVALALESIKLGTRRGFERSAHTAIMGVADAVIAIADRISQASMCRLEEDDLVELRSFPERLRTSDATIAALCEGLEGIGDGAGVGEPRDPVRVLTRAMSIIGDAVRNLETVLNEIRTPADHQRMSCIEAAKTDAAVLQ